MQENAAQAFLIGRSEFPGSHSVHVDLANRIRLRKNRLMECAGLSDASFTQWLALDRVRPFTVSVPPLPPCVRLPTRGLLVFGNPKQEDEADADAVTADCSMLFFRIADANGQATRESEKIAWHMQRDYLPMLRVLRRLSPSSASASSAIFREESLDRSVLLTLVVFYATVPADADEALLKQKLFAVDDDAPLGHVCAYCSAISAERRSVPPPPLLLSQTAVVAAF